MSFSQEVKEELSYVSLGKDKAVISELSAIFSMNSGVRFKGYNALVIQTHSLGLARRVCKLISKQYHYKPEIRVQCIADQRQYMIYINDSGLIRKHAEAVRDLDLVNLKQDGMRAYIRGAFLASGSISDPNSSYHFEIACNNKTKAAEIQILLEKFAIESKKVARSNRFVVYIKEGSAIVDTLNVMGAHKALMEMENVRIIKDVRNNLNRQVNCETANISKVVKSACKQIDDINLIIAMKGLSSLPPTLAEIAEVRLANPEATLTELGAMLEEPIGKSGVNHRLRKISEIADQIR